MIDTDKYIDCSSDRWIVTADKTRSAFVVKNGLGIVVAEVNDLETAILMRDSPKLLTEVKRLREENERLHEAIRGCDSMKCTWLYEGTYKEMTKHD